jgi:hypothetical protein
MSEPVWRTISTEIWKSGRDAMYATFRR